jgi:hypothetical protein
MAGNEVADRTTGIGLLPASDGKPTSQPSATYMINHQPFWTHMESQ